MAQYPNTYIGMRYVPLMAGGWDTTMQTEYEPLTVVEYQGNSYTSRTFVPKNINITNTEYWVLTGNYNAQVEQYRQEVQTFDGRITQNTNDITELEPMVRNNTISFNTLQLYTQDRLSNKKICVYGDSISAGYAGGTPWTNFFSTYLNSINSTLINKAVGGYTIGQVATSINSDTELNTYDMIIVQCGTNNIGGFPADTLAQCKTLSAAMGAFNGDKILITPFPRTDESVGSQYQNISQIRNIMYNTFQGQVTIIDGAAFPAPISFVDGLHPSTSSSQKISEFIKRAINMYTDVIAPTKFSYITLPASITDGTITTCQGFLNGNFSYVIINGSLTVPEGIKFFVITSDAVNSWINNAFINRTPLVVMQSGGQLALAAYNKIGADIQIITNATVAGTYSFTLLIQSPNMIYI